MFFNIKSKCYEIEWWILVNRMWLMKFILKKCERFNWNIGRIFMNLKIFEKVVYDYKMYEILDMGFWY